MLTLKVKDMSCGHCVATVTKTVKGLDPSAEIGTDLASRTVRVESGLDEAVIVTALDDAGYPSVRI